MTGIENIIKYCVYEKPFLYVASLFSRNDAEFSIAKQFMTALGYFVLMYLNALLMREKGYLSSYWGISAKEKRERKQLGTSSLMPPFSHTNESK